LLEIGNLIIVINFNLNTKTLWCIGNQTSIMANYKKEYWNKAKTKGVIISRSKLADGFNYYLTYMTLNAFKTYVINNSYKQKESIMSEAKAIAEAKKLIN
jgi:hypothetical protein